MQLKYCSVILRGFLSRKLLMLSALLIAYMSVQSQTISLSVNSAPLAQIFKAIEKQTDYKFIYTNEQLQNTKTISVNWKAISLKDAMNECLSDQQLDWVQEDMYVIIRDKPVTRKPGVDGMEITGVVKRENGEPLVGATIALKGTQLATSTDERGVFKLDGVKPGDILLVSSVGYAAIELPVTSLEKLSITLQQRVEELDEAIIVGYSTTSKRYNTGSVSKISAAEIARQPVANPLATIQGRATGVFVQTQNGLPGGNIRIQIRGQGSVAAGTNPLYIVDGVPFLSGPITFAPVANGANGPISPFSVISPADIASIEILKDAEASAIYGSRAANGVVLITTKKGSAGKSRLNLNVYTGINKVGRKIDFLSLEDYLAIRKEAFANAGVTPTVSNAPELLVWDQNKSTDWQDFMFGNPARLTDVQASVSGGSETTSYTLGGNFRTETTVLPGDDNYRRGGGHFSVNHQSADKKLTLNSSVSYSKDRNRVIFDLAAANIINYAPNYPIYKQDGTFNWVGANNPVAALQRSATSESNNLIVNTNLRYGFLREISLKLNLGYNKFSLDRIVLQPKVASNPANNPVSNALYASNSAESYIIEPFFNYLKPLKRLLIDALLGSTFQQTITKGSYVEGTNFSNDALLSSIGAAGLLRSQSNSYIEHKYVSLFARLNLRYLDQFLFAANFRRDGSTRFGPDKLYGNFGSVSGGWIFSNSAYVQKHFRFLSFGKIRLSYGITGNDQVPDYAYLSAYGPSTVYQDASTLRPLRLANDDFSWETSRKWDLGLELGFWKDRVLFTGSYYRSRTSNQLVAYPLPSQAGFSQYQANLPAVVLNTGYELELSSKNISTRRFSWRTSLNITIPKNILLEYPGLAQSSYANNYAVGEDLAVIKRIKFLGVDPSTGVAQFDDVNKDGRLTFADDAQVIGKGSPEFFGAFNNTLSWNGFDLSIFVQIVKQFGFGSFIYPGLTISNTYNSSIDRWRKPGDITVIPIPIVSSVTPAYNAANQLSASSFSFRNTSFIRLKNVEISYSFSKNILQKIALQNARLYLQGQNLLTYSRKQFLDPETLNGSNPAMPTMRQFVAGINLTL